jgi:hypothetical protein
MKIGRKRVIPARGDGSNPFTVPNRSRPGLPPFCRKALDVSFVSTRSRSRKPRGPGGAMTLACLRAGLAPALVILSCTAPILAQEGEPVRAPLPPQRPFDLDLEGTPKLPPIIVPPARTLQETASEAVQEAVKEASREAPESPPPTETPAAAATPDEPDDDEGPEWPKLTPGQKAGAEPDFDPNEKAERPGISTDPGTSIACLPDQLKQILNKIADRYGAVKVTSTWRPPWRARRGSYHKGCQAMDFRVPGTRPRTVLEWARNLPEVGGHQVYWNGLIHIDTGPRRPW